jgi:hypothetical protein
VLHACLPTIRNRETNLQRLGGQAKMGMGAESISSKARPPLTEASVTKRQVRLSGLIESGFASADPGAPVLARNSKPTPCYFERYEIAIGDWKTTIVKTLDYHTGLVSYHAG